VQSLFHEAAGTKLAYPNTQGLPTAAPGELKFASARRIYRELRQRVERGTSQEGAEAARTDPTNCI